MGGAVLGPIIGGVLLSTFWWGSVFLIAVPVMAVLLIAGPLLLPEYRNPHAGRLDLISVGLSLAAIMPFIYALKKIANDGWSAIPVTVLIAGVRVRRAVRAAPAPPAASVARPRLFKIGPLRTALGLSLLVGTVQGGSLLRSTSTSRWCTGCRRCTPGFGWGRPPSG